MNGGIQLTLYQLLMVAIGILLLAAGIVDIRKDRSAGYSFSLYCSCAAR